MRKLLFQLLVLFFSLNLSANTSERSKESQDFPSISIVGGAVNDLDIDVFMKTQDGIHYTLETDLKIGKLEFKEYNGVLFHFWGGTTFPNGIAEYLGDSFLISASGKYTISFNYETKEYSFQTDENIVNQFPLISILGDAALGWDKDVFMETKDGVSYHLLINLNQGLIVLRKDAEWFEFWGDGQNNNISISTAGEYNITFNYQTKEYNLELTGSTIDEIALQGVSTGFEAINMSTEDGIHYSLKNQLINKGFLYIKDLKNNKKWGSDYFPLGTAYNDLPLEINVKVGGYYNVSFNKFSGAFNFELLESLSPLNVGITGSSIEQESIKMLSTDNVNYFLKNQILTKGSFSFKDLDINTKWGANDFPSGTTSYYKSALIIDAAGDYDIFYNVLNGGYTFKLNQSLNPVAISLYDLTGGSTLLSELNTNDKILYTANNVSINAGYISFKYEDDLYANWGGLDFPNGKASKNQQVIQVKVGGIYDVIFNHLSKEYEFILVEEFPDINPEEPIFLDGTSVFLEPVAMSTKDGIVFTLKNQLIHKGGLIFKSYYGSEWNVTTIDRGVEEASKDVFLDFQRGYYDITFNLETKEYQFKLNSAVKPIIYIANPSSSLYKKFEIKNETEYYINDVQLNTGDQYNFQEYDFVPFVSWGGSQYPTGTAVKDKIGFEIGFEVPEDGKYNVTFNYETKEYKLKIAENDVKEFPSISILGSAVSDWSKDVFMETNDGIHYALTTELVEGYLRFRKNGESNETWGALDFPNGEAILNGEELMISISGTYYITFNDNTKEYTFEQSQIYANNDIYLDGNFELGRRREKMYTEDGVIFSLKNILIHQGSLTFEADPDNGFWYPSVFPNGIAAYQFPENTDIDYTVDFQIGYYNVTFNILTRKYSFELIKPSYKVVSINNIMGQNPKIMNTQDGIVYTLNNIELFKGQKLVFEVYNNWFVHWGGTQFPSGSSDESGMGILVNYSEFYDITFNSKTKEYKFELSNPNKIRYGIHGSAIDGFVELVEKEGIFVIEDIFLREGVLYVVSSDLVEFPVVIVANKGLSTKEEPIYLKRFEITTSGYYTITHNIAEAETMLLEKSLNVPTLNSISSFKVFPNPVQDGKVYFSEPSDVTVFDLFGRELLNKQEVNMLDVSGLSSGGYLLKNQKGQTVKLIVD